MNDELMREMPLFLERVTYNLTLLCFDIYGLVILYIPPNRSLKALGQYIKWHLVTKFEHGAHRACKCRRTANDCIRGYTYVRKKILALLVL